MLSVIDPVEVPSGEVITHCVLMPKVFSVIQGEKAEVFIGRKCIRSFQHYKNALIKQNKVFQEEQLKAKKIFKDITENGPIPIQKRKITVRKEVKIGYDDVI